MIKPNPILLLHGALGSQDQLATIQQELATTYTVYTLNFEGHGGRPSQGEFSINHFTQNVVDFLTEHGLTNLAIFGYSMGGYVALNLAIREPNLVDRIITFGTKFQWSPESAAKEVTMLNPKVIEEKVPQFAAHLKEIHCEDQWISVLEKTTSMMLELGDQPLLNASSLATIQQKVCIGIGSKDRMVSIEESQETANHLPNGTLHILKGFKHPIEQNNPKELANFIHKFYVPDNLNEN